MTGLLDVSSVLGISPVILILISIWSIIWKGLALWKSATRKKLVWFIVMLVVNTVGILEILYIFVFSEMGKKKVEIKEKSKK